MYSDGETGSAILDKEHTDAIVLVEKKSDEVDDVGFHPDFYEIGHSYEMPRGSRYCSSEYRCQGGDC